MASSISATLALLSISAAFGLAGCSRSQPQPIDGGSGRLTIYANGEEFVRQGFTTKDGWQISFDHVYATLNDVTAYQTDPPFNPDQEERLNAKNQVSIKQATTVDLAAGDVPVQVGSVSAPAGRYNALSWRMVSATEGVAQGYPLMMVGTATKKNDTIQFSLQIAEEFGFVCGDFIGDERKGFLQADAGANVEATFHFDHLFGDAGEGSGTDINQGALGFSPLAALAKDGQLTADSKALSTQLSAADYQKLVDILSHLGHVGEGHCQSAA